MLVLKPVTVITLAALLLACASNKLETCPSQDWNVIGYEDGKRGNTPYSARSMRKSCNDIATAYDDDAYNSGLKRGAREYCTPRNGYTLGRSGTQYNDLCDDDLKAAFVREHQLGLQHHAIDREADELRDELLEAQRERRRTQNHLENIRTGGSKSGYNSYEIETQSKNYMDRLSWLDARIKHLKGEIKKIEDRIDEPTYGDQG